MNNKQSINSADGDTLSNPKGNGIGLVWKIVIGVVAILVIAVFLYPLVIKQQPGDNNATSPTSVENQPESAEVKTTALANPDSAEAQFELGNSFYEAGQLDQAIKAYQATLQLNPNYQAAYANLGVVYYQQQKFSLAASQYEKALELKPEDGDVAYNLGALYLQQALSHGTQPDTQVLAQAIAQLESASAISPELAEPYFSLGVAYLVLNQQEKAIQAFETFLSFDSNLDPRAEKEAEKYLQTLTAQ